LFSKAWAPATPADATAGGGEREAARARRAAKAFEP
jgi:hypothetical protein